MYKSSPTKRFIHPENSTSTFNNASPLFARVLKFAKPVHPVQSVNSKLSRNVSRKSDYSASSCLSSILPGLHVYLCKIDILSLESKVSSSYIESLTSHKLHHQTKNRPSKHLTDAKAIMQKRSKLKKIREYHKTLDYIEHKYGFTEGKKNPFQPQKKTTKARRGKEDDKEESYEEDEDERLFEDENYNSDSDAEIDAIDFTKLYSRHFGSLESEP